MSDTETVPYDGATFFQDAGSQIELLDDAFSTGDGAYIRKALNTVARARGMAAFAKDAGLTREGLDRALSPEGDPNLSTLLMITKALGVSLSVGPTSATNNQSGA